MINVGVVGAAGKMGKTLITLIDESSLMTLTAAIEQAGSSWLGADAGATAGVAHLGVAISDDLTSSLSDVDVLIDFTIADATAHHVEACRLAKTAMVIGTTGLSDEQQAAVADLSRLVPVVFASNYSVGVNATFRLVEMAAKIFGDTVDVEIVEAHHKHKVDAPSGTAITLGERVASGLGKNLSDLSVHGREGLTGARENGTIGFHAVRGGEIVGEHTVMFISGGERLEITHRAQSRTNFADGAVRAAAWVGDQSPGLYDMQDVLGLSE
ncbi:MAG: 4-hydroxy-tetrahydrodipicolinate reductase [Candidatus Azotimanducaceae bacterium]